MRRAARPAQAKAFNEIENLECLAAHLERLPRHCFHGNQMTGFGNYISAIIYDAVEVLKDNS